MGGTTKSRFLVTLSVTDPRTGETRNLGEWDKLTGGSLDSADNIYRAAGGKLISLGGQINPANVVLERIYDLQRDHVQVGWLLAGVGIYRATITQVPTDASYAVVAGARPVVWANCTLKHVTPPEVDSTADTEAVIVCEFTTEGPPKQA